MEIGEALKIMRALADGVNPETGEVLTADAVYQYPPVVRALHRRCAHWNRGRTRTFQESRCRRMRASPGRAPKIEQVCEELRRGIDFHQIAKTHNRTIGSIIARLVKLGKIGPKLRWICLAPRWHRTTGACFSARLRDRTTNGCLCLCVVLGRARPWPCRQSRGKCAAL